jgi:predicted transposase YbfD/YdcC
LYPLDAVRLLILCAVMAGADKFVDIRKRGDKKIDVLRGCLPYARGIPGHDTLSDIMNALPPDVFCACLPNWTQALRGADPDIVAIDGKTSRRYDLSSAPLTAAQLSNAVRAHWGVENRLHRAMDVVFHDDLKRLRTGYGPANMTLIRHTAHNTLKRISNQDSLIVRKKKPHGTMKGLKNTLKTALRVIKRFTWVS